MPAFASGFSLPGNGSGFRKAEIVVDADDGYDEPMDEHNIEDTELLTPELATLFNSDR